MNFLSGKCNFAMKVHLIRKETIESFSRKNAQSRTGFMEFLTKLKYADWESKARVIYKRLFLLQICWEMVPIEQYLTLAAINIECL